MIVKILSNAITNIAITYGTKSYLCYAPVDNIGATFKLGSATIVPATTSESTFVNEVEVALNDQNPSIYDNLGNVYAEVYYYKENLGITEPTRV